MGKSNFRVRYIVDFETGGLKRSLKKDGLFTKDMEDKSEADIFGVTEVAIVAIDLDNLSIKDTYTSLVKPIDGRLYTAEALEVTGLTLKVLNEQGKSIHEVVSEMDEFFAKNNVKNKGSLGGHNFDGYDIHFLKKMYEDAKKRVDRYLNLDDTIDSLTWAKYKWTDSSDYKLGTCCANYGIDLVDAHRALPDTEANAQLIIQFLRDLRNGDNTKENENKFRYSFKLD